MQNLKGRAAMAAKPASAAHPADQYRIRGSFLMSLLNSILLPLFQPWRAVRDDAWRNAISHVLVCFLTLVGTPLEILGIALEWFLNFYTVNGGSLLKIFFKLILEWRLKLPVRGTPEYHSVICHLDPRLDLTDPHSEGFHDYNSKECAELCIMSSKLAYESECVQRDVLARRWDMCFYKFYNCLNVRTGLRTTQAFIFTDKPTDARLMVLAFRGTEPFDAHDWSTDFDFGWYRPSGNVGAIHMGFLEALGIESMTKRSKGSAQAFKNLSFRSSPDQEEPVYSDSYAYSAISKDLRNLLREHPNAKLIITGHSLGGALAVLFPGLMIYFNETREDVGERVLQSLQAIYTFGQPRVGDQVFADYLTRRLEQHNIEYHRVVYGFDMVSRVPSNDEIFGFMHAGRMCNYFDISYTEKGLREEPDANFFDVVFFVTARIAALVEFFNGLYFNRWLEGDWYMETNLMFIARVTGLFFPGLTGHAPTNYVNAVRMGPEKLSTRITK